MKSLTTALFALVAAAGVVHAGASKDEIALKDARQALTSVPAVDLRQMMEGQLQPFAVMAPAAVCDSGTPDIVIHDDGVAENGYGWNTIAGWAKLADKFTPPAYPAKVDSVCVSFITNAGVSSFPFQIAIYADDGTGGAPGTELGRQDFTAHPMSVGGVPATPTFEAFDVSGMALNITSGSVYIAAEWDAATAPSGVYLSVDGSPSTPQAGGYYSANLDPWSPLYGDLDYDDYQALFIRAVMPLAGPGAPSVQKAFAPTQIMAGGTSTLTITLKNNSQPTAAVLDADFVDNLPAGLVLAAPANGSTTCGGILVASDGASSVSLLNGGTIPAADSCTITVDVTGAADGNYVNTIAAGALSTQHGSNAGAATASLRIGFVFPEPYPPVTYPTAIEPITNVNFAGIDNTTPATSSVALEDFTAISGNVAPGGTFHMSVQGNTAGNFKTWINVYIDWNQDGVLDPATEQYQFPLPLENSTGTDGKKVELDITVPVTALGGSTRMRVMKKYGSSATYSPPNNNSGYGQAEDYTLNVIATSDPMVSKAFSPVQVATGGASTLTITLDNSQNATDATLTADFTDTFPTGLTVAATPNASTTCGSATLTANAGDGSVTLAAGATIPAGGDCTITVDVEGADGTYANTIAAGALETDNGDNPFPASANVTFGFIFPEPYCPISFSTIEPISRVTFDGIDNASNPAVGQSPALENFTSIVGVVAAGEIVHLAVQGNTNGNWTTVVTAYIDWNGDWDFDDPGESILVGNIVNSNGADGVKAETDITVPMTAVSGFTRMRITKNFSSPTSSACGSNTWGQAEDYTLLIAPPTPSVAKAFAPDTIEEGETSTLTITLTNPTASAATLTAPLVDTMPAGVDVLSATTSCGLIIGSAGPDMQASTITLPAGIGIPANGSCNITATVTAATAGSYVNTIAAGALQTDQGDNLMPASATLTVTAPFTDPIIGVSPGSLSASQAPNQTTTQTLTIDNTGGSDLNWSIIEEAARPQHGGPVERLSHRISTPRAPYVRDWSVAPLAEMISDGGFEAGDPNPYWDVDSLNFGTVLCDAAGCGTGGGSGPHGGTWWAWFGGIAAYEVGYARQDVTIAAGTATLSFWLEIPATSGDPADFLAVSIDGTEIFRATGADAAAYATYSKVTLDVSAFANGATHTLSFDSTIQGSDVTNFFVDDVSLDAQGGGSGCVSDDLPWLSVSPASGTTAPGASTNVTVTFDSTGLAAGTYSGKICVDSNDPANPQVRVPVSLTVTGGGGNPIAQVTPADFDFTVDEGDTGTDAMVITNIGGGTLTYSIAEAPEHLNPPSQRRINAERKDGLAPAAWGTSFARATGAQLRGNPITVLDTDISQMADNTPTSLSGLSCGTQTSIADNSWWRRFYFNEHPAVGASANVVSVTVAVEKNDVPGGLPTTVNLYTVPHSTPVDTIPLAGLTLIGTANFLADGSLSAVTVPVTGTIADTTALDLVVEWHTDGSSDGGFWPGANDTPETHDTFISSSTCSLNSPTPATDINFPDFHLVMIVTLEDGGPGPVTPCDSPSNVSWLSATPTSGSLAGGASDNVAVTVDATALSAGSYAANLCVTTNDPGHSLIVVPVTLTVESVGPPDYIFCGGFEDGEDGSCPLAPPPGGDIVTGMINQAITNDLDGNTFDFVTELWGVYDMSRVDDINLYNFGDGMTPYWYGDVVADGGGVDDGTGEYAILQSGDVVGPSSTFVTSGQLPMTNWFGGADGYLGVKFWNETTSQFNYGYIHLTTSSPDGYPAQALEYGYNKAGGSITIP